MGVGAGWKGTPDERFARRCATPDENGCISWTGGQNGKGYGRFTLDGRRHCTVTVYAHRFAYERAHGPIPDGMVIDHLCRNRGCVNIDHLEVVTPGENTRRGDSARLHLEWSVSRTTCMKGHPLDSENTRVDRAGSRICRTCARARKQRHLARRRQLVAEVSS